VDKPLNRLQRGFYRDGPSHRDGADVSFADIHKFFGFRSITIGKWVTVEEQKLAANLFFDALCDLAEILHVPYITLGLNQSLALAFGSGGRKGVSAHYTPVKRELALAKNAGAGSLAHEWFHAFDHYIAPKMFAVEHAGTFASALSLTANKLKKHPLNQRLLDTLHTILLSPIEGELNPLMARSVVCDKACKSIYFSLPQEVCARAFEAMVQDQPIKNHFLVSGTKQSQWAKKGLYPLGNQRLAINQSFLTYFTQLGQAIAYKQDSPS
jgi:hypothetical protein